MTNLRLHNRGTSAGCSLLMAALLAAGTAHAFDQQATPTLVDHFIVLENNDQQLGVQFFQFYLAEYFRGYFAEPHHYFDLESFRQDGSKNIRDKLTSWWPRPRKFHFDSSDQLLFDRYNKSDDQANALMTALFGRDKPYYSYKPIHRYDLLAYPPGRFLAFDQILPEEMPDPAIIRGYVEEYLEKTTTNWAPRREVKLVLSRRSLIEAGIPENEADAVLDQCRQGNALFLDHRGILHFGEPLRPRLYDWHDEFAALSPAEQRRYSATACELRSIDSSSVEVGFAKGFGLNPEHALVAILLPDDTYWQRQGKTPFYIPASRRGGSNVATHYENLLSSMIGGAGTDGGPFFPYRPKGLELSFRSYLLRWRNLCTQTPPIYIPAYSLWKVGYRSSLPSRDPSIRIAPVLGDAATPPLGALAEALAAFPSMYTNQLAASNQTLLDYWYGTVAPPATAELQQSQVPFVRLQPENDLPALRQMPDTLLGRNSQTQMLEGKPQVFVDLQLLENIGESGLSKQVMWVASQKFFPHLISNENRPKSDIVQEQLKTVEFTVYAGILSMPVNQAERRRYYQMLSFLQTGGIPQEKQDDQPDPQTLGALLRKVYKWLFTSESTIAANQPETDVFEDPVLAQRLAEMITQTSGWHEQAWTVERGGDLDGFVKMEVDFRRVDYLGHLVGVAYKQGDDICRMLLISDQQGGVKSLPMPADFSFLEPAAADKIAFNDDSETLEDDPEPIDWRRKLDGKIIYTFYLRSTPQYFQATDQGRKRILEEMTGSYLPQISTLLQSRFFTQEHMQRYILPASVSDATRAQALAASAGTAVIGRTRPSSVMPSMWRYHAHNPGDVLDFHPNRDAWFHALPPDSPSPYVRSLYHEAENNVRAHMRARLRELGPHQVTLTSVTLALPEACPQDWDNMQCTPGDWQLIRQAVTAGEAVFVAHQDQLLHFSSEQQQQLFMDLLSPDKRPYDADISALVAAEPYQVEAAGGAQGTLNVHFADGMRLLTADRNQTGIGIFLRAGDAYDALHERDAFNQWVSGTLRADGRTDNPLQTRHFALPFAKTAKRLQVIVPPFVLAYLDPADIRLNQVSPLSTDPTVEPNWPFRFDHKQLCNELARLGDRNNAWQHLVAEGMRTREDLRRWIPDLVQLGGMPVLPTRNLWYVNAQGNVVTGNPEDASDPYAESIPVPTRTILQGAQIESLPWVLQPGFGGDLAEQLVQPLNTVPLTYFRGRLHGKIQAACYVIPKTIDTINQLSALSGREVRIDPELVVGPQEEPRSFWSGLLYTLLQPALAQTGKGSGADFSDTLATLLTRCEARPLGKKYMSVKINALKGRLELLLANTDGPPYLCHVWFVRAADAEHEQAFVIVGGLTRGALPLVVTADFILELPQGDEALIDFGQ